MNKLNLNEILQAWPDFAPLQIVSQVLRKLEENNIPLEEFYKWIEEKGKRIVTDPQGRMIRRLRKQIPRATIIRLCPMCGKVLSLGEVNTASDNQVGGTYQSQWYCYETKGGCGWSEFSNKSLLEEAAPYLVKM